MAQVTKTTPPRTSTVSRGFEVHRKSPTGSKLKFYAVGLIIVLAAGFIGFNALQGATVYYFEVHDYKAKIAAGNTFNDAPVRVAGKVVPGSIVKDNENHSVTFVTRDMNLADNTIKVTYGGTIPDTFKDDAQVVVTGKLDGKQSGTFVATEMLAKCPSKYSTTASQ